MQGRREVDVKDEEIQRLRFERNQFRDHRNDLVIKNTELVGKLKVAKEEVKRLQTAVFETYPQMITDRDNTLLAARDREKKLVETLQTIIEESDDLVARECAAEALISIGVYYKREIVMLSM